MSANVFLFNAVSNIPVYKFTLPFFSFILLIHEGSHREVYQEFQPSYDIFLRSGAKGCSDHRFRAPPAYTAQLLTLHQHRANNQYLSLIHI